MTRTRYRLGAHALAVALAFAIGVMCARYSLVAIISVAIGAIAIAAIAAPRQLALTLVFLTAAFPKAGVKVGEFPFPIFIFGLVLAVAILPRLAVSRAKHSASTVLALTLLLGWVLIRSIVLLESGGAARVSAYIAWAAIPATLVFLVTRVSLPDRAWTLALERGFILAAAYAIVQWAWGIEATKVPGLTIAWGDSYASKNVYVIEGDMIGFSKIMSTYQNGNIFGVTAAVLLVVAGMRVSSRAHSRHDWLLLAAAGISVVLSGSRTALLAVVAGAAALLLLRASSLTRKLALLAGAGLGFRLAVMNSPDLVTRYSLQSVMETGGTGRLDAWTAALSQASAADLLFGSASYWFVEGGVGLILLHGLVGAALLGMVVILTTRARRLWRVPFFVLAVAALADTSFSLFPTWFLPAAAAACPILAKPTVSTDGEGATADGVQKLDAPSADSASRISPEQAQI